VYRKSGDGSGGDVKVKGRSAREVAAEQAEQGRSRTVRAIPGERARATVSRATGKRAERDRLGGVAPWVAPRGRLGRRLRMREWARRGFVPLSPGRQKLRHRILPRTVIGIAFMLLATAVGAAFSGAAFYAYYDDRLAENERTVARFVEGFDQQFTDAAAALDDMRTEAVGTIRDELEPLGDYVDDAGGVVGLPATAGPSVWLVETRDENGAVSVGSAFAIVGHRGGTALLTSHSVVRAATVQPGPAIELLKGDRRVSAELWAWDEERDLALVVVGEEIPILSMAGEEAQVASVGRRVFAMSGFGGQGATASPGVLVDHSSVGVQHTAPLGSLFVGGPLLDGEGRVLGMASTAYRPLGVDAGPVAQGPDIAGLCARILRCSEVDEVVSAEVVDG
jgi:S1-C subfamily serine protease